MATEDDKPPQIMRGTSGGDSTGSVPLTVFMDQQWSSHQRVHASEQHELNRVIDMRKQIIEGWQELHTQAHAAEARERESAYQSLQERLVGMNEFRNQLSNERVSYVTRDMLDVVRSSATTATQLRDDRIAKIENELASMRGAGEATARNYAIVMGLIVLVVSIAFKFVGN